MSETVVLRINSHRARRKLESAGIEGEAIFSFDRWATGGFLRVPASDLDAARQITGVSKTHDGDDFMRCWKMSGR